MRLRQRSLSRHFSSADNLLAEARSSSKTSAEPRSRTPVSRYLPYDTPAWLVHPALPLLLFVFALGVWALVQHVYHDCAFVGPDSGWCLRQQHGPNFNLSRGQVGESWLPNWREDGRCGPGFPALNGHSISICNPFSKEYCCSRWGWCGSGGEYCIHAAAKPYNETQGGQAKPAEGLSCLACMCLPSTCDWWLMCNAPLQFTWPLHRECHAGS